jgi:hypothetical protein
MVSELGNGVKIIFPAESDLREIFHSLATDNEAAAYRLAKILG